MVPAPVERSELPGHRQRSQIPQHRQWSQCRALSPDFPAGARGLYPLSRGCRIRPARGMAPALMVGWIEGGAGFFLFSVLPGGAVELPGRSRPAPGVVDLRRGGRRDAARPARAARAVQRQLAARWCGRRRRPSPFRFSELLLADSGSGFGSVNRHGCPLAPTGFSESYPKAQRDKDGQRYAAVRRSRLIMLRPALVIVCSILNRPVLPPGAREIVSTRSDCGCRPCIRII